MSILFNCSNPACRERIEADESLAGSEVNCPACGGALHVPHSKEITFDCNNPKCGIHIIVDVSEAGRVTKCPACQQVLRIPGDPPKSLAPAPRPRARTSAPPLSVTERLHSYPVLASLKRLTLGWGLGAALFGMLLLGFQMRSQALIPPHLDRIADEIYSHGGTKGEVVESSSGKTLFYLQEDDADLNVFQLDRTTFDRKRLLQLKDVVRNDNFKWLSWSPDRQRLAYLNREKPDAGDYQLFLCDGNNGESREVFKINACGLLSEGIWLGPDSLVLLNRHNELFLFNFKADSDLGRYGTKGLVKLPPTPGKGLDCLTPNSDRSIAYFREGHLRTLDLPTGEEKILSSLPEGAVTELSYNATREMYLFMLRDPGDRNKFSIYQYGPASSRTATMTCLARDIGHFPRWIQDGKGMAYVSSTTNLDQLVIAAGSGLEPTNLLASSEAKVSIAGIAGDHVYAVAFDERQIWRIWEYDTSTRSLRKFVPRDEGPAFRQIAPPVLASLTNALNKRVDYYYVLPVGLDPQKRYPVLVDQNSAARFDQSPQLFANLGVIYVSPNRFGLKKWSDMPKPEDTQAVYQELLKHPNVDPGRFYIVGHSISTATASEVVNVQPKMWRGIIMISPAPQPPLRCDPTDYPRIFISVGDSDKFIQPSYPDGSHKYVQDACRQLIPVQIEIVHAGHTYNSPQLMECCKSIAKFIAADR